MRGNVVRDVGERRRVAKQSNRRDAVCACIETRFGLCRRFDAAEREERKRSEFVMREKERVKTGGRQVVNPFGRRGENGAEGRKVRTAIACRLCFRERVSRDADEKVCAERVTDDVRVK